MSEDMGNTFCLANAKRSLFFRWPRDQRIWPEPLASQLLRRKDRHEIERPGPRVNESMRHAGRDFNYVGRFGDERLFSHLISGSTLQKDVSLFKFVHVQIRPAARLSVRDYE